jgi:exodeoxyribonuclease VII small subunit
MASKKEKAESEGFEALYQRLDETVQKLENGGLTLEESVTMYEEGMKLAKRCQELLQEAELKVTRLQESFEESIGALREEVEEYEAEMDLGDEEED